MMFKLAVIVFLIIARRVCLKEDSFTKSTAKLPENSNNAKFSTVSKKTTTKLKKNDTEVSLQTNETTVSLFA